MTRSLPPGMKLARVADSDATSISTEKYCGVAEVGDRVVVPEDYPDNVCVLSTTRGYRAKKSGWCSEEDCEVFPETTREEAISRFCEERG